MTTSTDKLVLARDKVTQLRKTAPQTRPGSKFADVENIFADEHAAAVITSSVDEILMCKEAIKMLQDEIKGHEQACLASFCLNPKVLRALVIAQSTPVLDDLNDTIAAINKMYGPNQSDTAGYNS